MDWNTRLSDAPLSAVQVLDGDPPLVCAWSGHDTVYFYAPDDGSYYGGLDLSGAPDDMHGETWRDFLEGLRAPNGAYLPVVNLGHTVVLTSNDGRLHVYERDHRQLIVDVDGQQTTLEREGDAILQSVGLDRELGTIGALGHDNRLHLYQQHIYLGAYTVEHKARSLCVPDESGAVVVVGEQQIQVIDTSGHVQYAVETASPIGAFACAPDGSRIVITDQEQGILRAYNGQLRLLRQETAHHLLKRSTPLDNMPEHDFFLPLNPETVALSNTGQLSFSMGGFLCCTHIKRMPALPQPRKLF